MITTVTLGSVTLYCDYVDVHQASRVIRIPIPGRQGDVFQTVGKSSNTVEIRGILKGASKDTDKATLEGYEGETQTYNDGTNNFTMIVSAVIIPTVGGQPNHYNFSIRGYEYD